jgi:hypothetical protein
VGGALLLSILALFKLGKVWSCEHLD